MGSTETATSETAKAGLAPEVQKAVRKELEHLQDWMADWRKQHHQLLVDSSQLLRQVIERQQEIRAPLSQTSLQAFRRKRSPGSCGSSQWDLSVDITGAVPSASSSLVEGKTAHFVGVMPVPPVRNAGATQPDCCPSAPRLLCCEASEAPQSDLPNVVQVQPAYGSTGSAKSPNKPVLSNACSFESVPSPRETARAQWAEHLRSRVTEQLGNERQRTWACHPCRRIGLYLASGSACASVVSGAIRWLVLSRGFQWCCAGIVLLNVVFTGYSTNSSMDHALATPAGAAPTWFEDGNRTFTVLYCIELFLRLLAFGHAFFTGPDQKWHAFDAVLVLTSLMEEMVQGVDMSIVSLRVIRVLRMVRVLRIIRVMRFCRDLRLMVSSIMQSLSSLTWAFVLLLIIMYLFTVVFMQGPIMYLQDPLADGDLDDIRDGIVRWYGSLFSTMYTLLASILGGVDWVDAALPLEKMSMVYRVLFSFYVLFMVIGVLNVLTGIFVERACELSGLDRDCVIQAQLTREEAFRLEMKRIFEEADVDGSGKITWEKFRGYLENDRVKAYLSTQQLDAYDARTLFDMLKGGKEDEIGVEAFIVGCQRLKGTAKSVDLMAVLEETRSANRRLRALVRKVEHPRTMDFARTMDFSRTMDLPSLS